jgi:hypothetical protein
MAAIQIRRVRSAVEDSFAWVSLWYGPEARKFDALHLACEKTAGDGIYMERYGQAVACYDGVKRVLVKGDRLEFQFNARGKKALRLSTNLRLVAPKHLVGWKKACRVLQEMAGYPSASVLTVA